MVIKTKEDYKQLINKLKSMSAGEQFISFSYKIIKTQKDIIGVRTPDLRKLAKEISKNEHQGLYNYYEDKYFEEILIRGLVICYEKDFIVATKLLESLYRSIDNWAIVDMIVGGLAFVKHTEEKMCFEYFKNLTNGDEFTARFGIVAFMKFFIYNETWVEKVFDVLKSVECGKYYVDMAIAWLFAEILVKFPQKALKNMQKIIKINHFNKFIINKSIQKACESYRLDKTIKNKLREMKVKC